MQFPRGEQVHQLRIARPTDQLDALIAFYGEALGLSLLRHWRHGADCDHFGYDGAVFGLPDETCQLEFTQHEDGSPCPAPSRDNLLVLYVPEASDVATICERLDAAGYASVEPENPWWSDGGVTYEDPDGWRLVIMQGQGLQKRS